MSFRIGQQFATLDGSHDDADPVPNRHLVELTWWRTVLDVGVKLDEGWWAGFSLPYDVKDQKARYELPDGTPYDNPEGDLHHRTETLRGFGDADLTVNYAGGGWRLGAGFSLPLGRIEDDPYELGALGLKHQHIQFGTGTFQALLRVGHAEALADDWFVDASFSARLSLYENRKDYLAPSIFELSFGPSWAAADGFQLQLRYQVLYQTRGEWSGDRDPNTGYSLHAVRLAASIDLGGGFRLGPYVNWVADVDVRGSETFELEWIFGVSVDWDAGAPAAETPDESP